MQVVDHHPRQELLSMARLKRFGRIRHRLRCVVLAMEGRTAPEIDRSFDFGQSRDEERPGLWATRRTRLAPSDVAPGRSQREIT